MSRHPLVYYCMVTKQLSMIELHLVFIQTSTFFTFTVGFRSEDNCHQSQELEKSIKDMLIKSILKCYYDQIFTS